jgi:hypothetical protein
LSKIHYFKEFGKILETESLSSFDEEMEIPALFNALK